MKLIYAMLGGLMATLVSGYAIPVPDPEAEADADVSSLLEGRSDADIIASTAEAWSADTATVARFLDSVAANQFRSQSAYAHAAAAALAVEAQQVALQKILDLELITSDGTATSNISNGTTGVCYSTILQLFKQLTKLDYRRDRAAIVRIVNQINFGSGNVQGLCNAVLPSIDTWFEEADAYLESSGDSALSGLRAARPRACQQRRRDVVLDGE